MQLSKSTLSVVLWVFIAEAGVAAHGEEPAVTEQAWQRHVIDGSSRGADGVRLADVNGDGLLDITTGWEEGGITRVYVHPGYEKASTRWPAVTVGTTRSVEDAVFGDIDDDGAVDVVSSCEGGTKCVFVHWAPPQPKLYLRSAAWQTEAIPVTQGKTAWMFALPMQLDERHGIDIVVASKGKNAVVGWLQAPADPRNMDGWKLHPLYDAGWIMSLVSADVNDDGDSDLIVSDRKGKKSGVLWLENPGAKSVEGEWIEHRIGASGREVMFLDAADLDGDGNRDIIAAVKPDEIHWFRQPKTTTEVWPRHVIRVAHPAGTGTAKGVRVGDMDGDGKPDIVYSCEHATPPRRGVVWLEYDETPEDKKWSVHDISGAEGIKFDRIELLDMDGDEDLDVLTCEERHQNKGIGVFWFENPTGRREPSQR